MTNIPPFIYYFLHLVLNGQNLLRAGSLPFHPHIVKHVSAIGRTACRFRFVHFELLIRRDPWRSLGVLIPSDFGVCIGNIPWDFGTDFGVYTYVNKLAGYPVLCGGTSYI